MRMDTVTNERSTQTCLKEVLVYVFMCVERECDERTRRESTQRGRCRVSQENKRARRERGVRARVERGGILRERDEF